MQYLTCQELQEYFHAGHIGFWKLELEKDQMCRMYVDERMGDLVGVSKEATPEECYDFFIEHVYLEDLPRLKEHRANMMFGDAEIIYRYDHPVQGEIQIQCSGRKVKEQDGKIVLMGYHREFSDAARLEEKRKKEILENALANANRKNEIITAISRQYWQVFEVDLKSDTYQEVFTEGRFTMDAPSFSGKAREDFGKVLNDCTAEEYLVQLRDFLNLDTIAARLADTDAVTMEFRSKVGFWASVRYLALTRDSDGCVTKVIFLLEIIDKQKRKELEYQKKLKESAEEASRANAAKTNFLRRMSHDIRTPLNGIIGLLKIDETHCDDFNLIRENRRKMLTSADHLLSLINDVLQMSKLEDGKNILTHELICLYDLTQNIVDIIIGRAVESGIRWVYEKGKSEIPYPYIYGSPLHLRQIFLNIYGNCIKYNRPGGKITTTVDTLPEHDGICTYHWIISDTGIGMSEEFLKHLFEPFTQERSDGRSAYQGTGLGMSIVKGLLDQMGGTISVTSELGVGSTFEITIPFEIAPPPALLTEQDAQEERDIRGLRILLAEDNALNAEIAQILLTDEGAVVTVVYDGQKAVEQFRDHPAGSYDVILMDMMMPVMDGLTATTTIRAMDRSDAKTIPIIAMTANAFEEDAKKCLEAGMNAHLAKPIDIQKVKQVISQQIKTR